MENQEDERYLTLNKTVIFIPHLKDWTKEQFVLTYKGKVQWDLDNGWIRVEQRLKKLGLSTNLKYSENRSSDESTTKTSKKHRKA